MGFTHWLDKKSSQYLYESYYRSHKQEVTKIINYYKKAGKKVVIWGIGKKGQVFLDTIDPQLNSIDNIVDLNSQLIHTKYNNKIEIIDYQELADEKDTVVFIVNGVFYANNLLRLQEKGFQGVVFDLDDIVRNKVTLDQILKNEYTRKFVDDIDYSAIHHCLLKILKEIDRICKENNITYFLEGGSALGAVRHKGFIPWDDDADIGMPREDFEKFRKIAQKELKPEYFFQTVNKKSDYYQVFDQVGIIESSYTSEEQLHLNIYHGIQVDIFAYDYFSENEERYEAQRLQLLKYTKKLRDKKCKIYTEETNLWKKWIINYKYYLSKFVSLHSLMKKIDFLQKDHDNSIDDIGYWLPESKKLRSFAYKDIMPVRYVSFEDTKLPIPNNADAYLSKVYGDYMTPPPQEVRIARNRIVDVAFDRKCPSEHIEI